MKTCLLKEQWWTIISGTLITKSVSFGSDINQLFGFNPYNPQVTYLWYGKDKENQRRSKHSFTWFYWERCFFLFFFGGETKEEHASPINKSNFSRRFDQWRWGWVQMRPLISTTNCVTLCRKDQNLTGNAAVVFSFNWKFSCWFCYRAWANAIAKRDGILFCSFAYGMYLLSTENHFWSHQNTSVTS